MAGSILTEYRIKAVIEYIKEKKKIIQRLIESLSGFDFKASKTLSGLTIAVNQYRKARPILDTVDDSAVDCFIIPTLSIPNSLSKKRDLSPAVPLHWHRFAVYLIGKLDGSITQKQCSQDMLAPL